jgi:hypothetical protein
MEHTSLSANTATSSNLNYSSALPETGSSPIWGRRRMDIGADGNRTASQMSQDIMQLSPPCTPVVVLLCVVMGFYTAASKPSYGSLHLFKSMRLMPSSCNRPVELKTLSKVAPEPITVKTSRRRYSRNYCSRQCLPK